MWGDRVSQSFSKARFLTVQEVADLMRVSSMTVYRLIKAGELPAVRVGRSFRVRAEVDDGYLVGPDNGLLAAAAAILGGARRVVALTSEEHRLPAPGPTFAGRDVMAPAAAYLANGVPITDLGDEVDPAGLVPGMVS